MRKFLHKMLPLILAMVLVASAFSMVAFAVEAANHVHNYEVTNDIKYDYYSNSQHVKKEVHTHTCDCGDVFLEYHILDYLAHVASGRGTYAYSIWVAEGITIDYYTYNCKLCNHSFTREEL